MKKLRKVVIPIAGLGTRMLPATKAIPKEMLPVVDKPIIQYIVEEAEFAGFKEIIFVTHSSKYSVENHFDTSFELEATLEKRVKRSLLKSIKSISNLKVTIHSVRQGEAKGLGHAIHCAKSIIGDEPFGIMLPDMMIMGNNKSNNLSLMKELFEKENKPLILLGKSNRKNLSNYGIVKLSKIKNLPMYLISAIVEKPSPEKAPSNKYAIGRYIFDNSFLSYLPKTKKDKYGEIQLTDAISLYINDKKDVLGLDLEGKVFDCGDKLGYLKAIVECAKNNKSIGKNFSSFLNSLIKKNK